mgnify:FL=1
MTLSDGLLLAVALGLLVFLVVALLAPEKF